MVKKLIKSLCWLISFMTKFWELLEELDEFNVIWRRGLGLIPQMSTVLSDIMFNPGLLLWNSDIISSLCKEIVFLFDL